MDIEYEATFLDVDKNTVRQKLKDIVKKVIKYDKKSIKKKKSE